MTASTDTSAGAPARCGIRAGHETEPRDCEAVALIAAPEAGPVVIASPDGTYEEFVVACLEAGKPVLCEKPLVMTAAENNAGGTRPAHRFPQEPQ
jgi:predicted dehydrogenase